MPVICKVVEKLLKHRHKKHADWEGIVESINGKQAGLVKLEAVESESQRISAALLSSDAPRGGGGGGIMAKLNSWVDNDPELTRRNNISKTRDAIADLTEREVEAKVWMEVVYFRLGWGLLIELCRESLMHSRETRLVI
jgi:hypothetical protein